jgi:HK97 family phage major capsid protein
MKTKNVVMLALLGLGILSALAAMACGVDVNAFAQAHQDVLSGLSMLCIGNIDYIGEVAKHMAESNEALAKMKEDLNERIVALENREAKSRRPGNPGAAAEDSMILNLEKQKTLYGPDQFKSFYEAKAKEREEEQFSLIDFMRGIADMKTSPSVTKALAVGTSSAGGYTVPNLLQSGILQALVPASSLLKAGTGIIPIDGGQTSTFAAVNSIPQAAWRLENGAVAESDPAFRAVVASPRSLAFFFKISRELLADGVDIESTLRAVIAQSFAKELDRVGLRGSGSAPEPRGILNTVGIQAVTNGTNGTVLGGYSNLFSAVQSVLQADAPMPTAAIMAPRSLVKLAALLDSTNQPVMVPQMLKSMQLISTSQVPITLTVGTSTDCSEIYAGDFSQTAFAMRENVSIQVADQLYAGTGQVAFIGHVRADFIVKYPTAFSVVTGVR